MYIGYICIGFDLIMEITKVRFIGISFVHDYQFYITNVNTSDSNLSNSRIKKFILDTFALDSI